MDDTLSEYIAIMSHISALADVGCATTATAEGKTANDATQNLIWAQVSYCVTDLSTTKNQESFIKESVHAWLDQVKNFKYAGADKKIIDDCKKSDGNAELKLDELLKNTFLISVGVNNKNMGCSYLDQTQGSETGAIKAQFILCAFEQKAEVTAVSITKNVYFGDEVFNKHCDQTSTYKIEKCSSNNQQCTGTADIPEDVSSEVNTQIQSLIPEGKKLKLITSGALFDQAKAELQNPGMNFSSSSLNVFRVSIVKKMQTER